MLPLNRTSLEKLAKMENDMFTRETIEAALDKRILFAHMRNGKWWRVRRNGKTQTWKREPMRFRIPVKAGLRAYGEITNGNMNDGNWRIEE